MALPGRVPRAGGNWTVYLVLLFTVTAWGGSFVAARLVLAGESPDFVVLSPTLLAAVRFLLASLLLLPILYRQHRQVPLRLGDVPAFLLVGLFGISFYFWLQFTGLRLTNAGLSAVLVVGTIPLATTLLASLALGEPLTRRRLLALALGAAGVLVVVSQQGLAIALESGFLLGTVCLIANALCFAIYSTLVRGLRARYVPLTVTAGRLSPAPCRWRCGRSSPMTGLRSPPSQAGSGWPSPTSPSSARSLPTSSTTSPCPDSRQGR